MKGGDLFSILSGKILVDLSEAFPIPRLLDRENYLKESVNFDSLRDVAMKRSNVEFLTDIQKELDESKWTDSDHEDARRMAEDLKRQEHQLENDIGKMRAVWSGTIDFLESEGYIRSIDRQDYQLTAKGLSHLSKSISIGGKDSHSILGWLKEAVEPKELANTVANGSLAFTLTKLFGG